MKSLSITKEVVLIYSLFLLDEQPVDEVPGVGGDVVEGLVLVVVLGDRHVGHRLQVRVTHEGRQPRQPVERNDCNMQCTFLLSKLVRDQISHPEPRGVIH